VGQICINYSASINDQTVSRFFEIIHNKLKENVDRFVILISSPGGMVRSGISAYNFLKGLPVEVITHNYGMVDSIAVVLFCSGSKRYCSPNARFLIHGIGFNAQPNQRFDERSLKERLTGLENERITISKIISENSTRSLKDIEQDMLQGVVWDSQQAKSYGLVHEIKEPLCEKGAEIIGIVDTTRQQAPPQIRIIGE